MNQEPRYRNADQAPHKRVLDEQSAREAIRAIPIVEEPGDAAAQRGAHAAPENDDAPNAQSVGATRRVRRTRSDARNRETSASVRSRISSKFGKVGDVRGIFGKRGKRHGGKPHKPSALTRVATQWAERLLDAAHDRSFHAKEEQYESSKTQSDFLWNTISMGAWGVVFPLLTIIVTQLSGAEQAGMFSMAFVVATLLMILANFGIRTFQVSDIREEYSFADYRVNRFITVIAAILAGSVYCALRGYDGFMTTCVMGVVVYKSIDGFADVYEGRLQQMGKMYLAGVSLTVRSVLVFLVFCLVLLVTGSLAIASVAMAVIAVLTLLFFSLPLAHMETPKSAPATAAGIVGLFRQSWPLFAALFMYSLVDNMPKFVMEGMLSYDNQLYYNALYFPAMFILMTAQTVYKPMLVKMAEVWHDPEKRRRFDLIILAVALGIAALTAVTALVMMWIGLDILGLLYGLDFRQFQKISVLMLIAGGMTAGIDFIYQTITILRRQKDVIVAYVIALVLALFTPSLLIEFAELEGAVLSYLIIMTVLFILMLWIYFRIRFTKEGRAGGVMPDSSDANGAAADEAAAREPVPYAAGANSESDVARAGTDPIPAHAASYEAEATGYRPPQRR